MAMGLRKSLKQSNFTGHVAEAVVTHAVMKYWEVLYRGQPGMDVGIDGEIERLKKDGDSYLLLSEIAKTQIKGKINPAIKVDRYGHYVSYSLRVKDLEYFKNFSGIPIILFYVNLSRSEPEVYWRLINPLVFDINLSLKKRTKNIRIYTDSVVGPTTQIYFEDVFEYVRFFFKWATLLRFHSDAVRTSMEPPKFIAPGVRAGTIKKIQAAKVRGLYRSFQMVGRNLQDTFTIEHGIYADRQYDITTKYLLNAFEIEAFDLKNEMVLRGF